MLDAGSLSPSERAELLAKLLEQTARDAEAHEATVGERGLAAWTEAARSESWEAYYPPSLRNSRRPVP